MCTRGRHRRGGSYYPGRHNFARAVLRNCEISLSFEGTHACAYAQINKGTHTRYNPGQKRPPEAPGPDSFDDFTTLPGPAPRDHYRLFNLRKRRCRRPDGAGAPPERDPGAGPAGRAAPGLVVIGFFPSFKTCGIDQ